MDTVTIIINGKACTAQKGQYLLDVARENRIGIPSLCHHSSLRGSNSCRLCIVEIKEGERARVVTSCTFPVTKEMTVETNTEKIKEMRKVLVSLMKAQTPNAEKVTVMSKAYGISDYSRYEMQRENECVLCGLCVKACEKVGCSAISTIQRGTSKKVATPYDLASDDCMGCGSCAYVCPTDCIQLEEKDGIRRIWNKDFHLIHCSVCGAAFMTEEQYRHIHQESVSEDDPPVCEDCRKEQYARKLVEVYL